MSADVIKQLVPFGIVGLAIVAIVILMVSNLDPQRIAHALGTQEDNVRRGSQVLIFIGALLIAGLAVFDKVTQLGKLEPAKEKPAEATPSGTSGAMYWVDTGTSADWGGRDSASTFGLIPKYSVATTRLCDENHAGSIAVCWDNRPSGYPSGVATDITGLTPQWCTYKDSSIRLSTSPDGKAPPGRVYLCARSIPHT